MRSPALQCSGLHEVDVSQGVTIMCDPDHRVLDVETHAQVKAAHTINSQILKWFQNFLG